MCFYFVAGRTTRVRMSGIIVFLCVTGPDELGHALRARHTCLCLIVLRRANKKTPKKFETKCGVHKSTKNE